MVQDGQMERGCCQSIKRDLENRIVLLSGPRQVGKTTLSKMLFERFEYLNHDFVEHRLEIRERSWDREVDLLVLDELHKMKNWKSWLKGIYDVEGSRPRILVTGSARLDIARKMGDSLAGRFFGHRLHPFDLKELAAVGASTEAFDTLMRVGGFPEPFLAGTERFYRRWRKSHIDIILRQDLPVLETVSDIQAIETLVELTRRRVGTSVSMSNLARDLERDPKTVKRWMTVLENLYVVFKVPPYHRRITRSLLKEPKFYFFDNGLVRDEGAKLENLVACALKKELDRLNDEEGRETSLCYLRTKDKREVDFAVCVDGEVIWMIEVKTTDDTPSKSIAHFAKFLPRVRKAQLVLNLKREKTYPDGTEVRALIPWLENMDLMRGFNLR
jgi:predicted AAA+ superfamily ATPase